MLRSLLLFCLLLTSANTSAQLLASTREANYVNGIGYLPDSRVDTFIYDLRGRLTEVHAFNIGTNQHLPNQKQLLSYDQQGRIMRISYFRANASGSFDSTGFDLHHYNQIGKLKNIEHHALSNGSMQFRRESLYTYFDNGQLRSKEFVAHHTPTRRIIEKEDYHFNSQQRLDSVSYFIWRDGRLQYASRNVYQYYDSIGEQHIQIESLNPWTFQHEKTGEFRNFYASGSGKLDSSTRHYFHEQSDERYKIEYRRLLNDSISETEEFVGSPWKPILKRTYAYRDFQPLQKVVVSNRLHIFPNPAQQQLQVDQLGAAGGQLLIFDLRGQLKKSELLRSDRQVLFVGDLPAGIYILQLTTPEGQTSTAKLVKQ